MTRVPVNPDLVRWACERSGIARADLVAKFANLPEWESGETRPTLKQLETFARAVHAPVGYLFLTDPPEDSIPIPDFRTFAGQVVTRPSPNLLDTIYACQERQDWYGNFASVARQPERTFVGRATVETPPETVAADMCETLGFDIAARRDCQTQEDAFRLFVRQAEDAGILVMFSGVVMSNTRRRLDPNEFRSFALSDPRAPLIFVNGADAKAAQMFTLAHELAHLWLGATALSNPCVAPRPGLRREEVWCNAVAAELLVPHAAFRAALREAEPLSAASTRLARAFRVSTLVILCRLLDAGWMDRPRFDTEWAAETERLRTRAQREGGGDFHRTTLSHVSRRFARAVVVSTREGQTLYRDAFRMLGVSKTETFDNLAREAGAME